MLLYRFSGHSLVESLMCVFARLGCGVSSRAPRELLSRLPSTLILTADQDPLQDEGEAFYERVLESGVAAQHVRYNKTIHLFFGRVSTGGAQSMHHVSNWFKDTCGCPRAARARVARYTRMQRGESPYPLIL